MFFTVLRRRFTAWVAIFAILVGALAPSISHAISASQGELWMEICTPTGIKYVKYAADEAQVKTDDAMKSSSFEHCPFCSIQQQAPALPSAQTRLDVPSGPDRILPALFYSAPHTLAIWQPAQSRAPPAQRA